MSKDQQRANDFLSRLQGKSALFPLTDARGSWSDKRGTADNLHRAQASDYVAEGQTQGSHAYRPAVPLNSPNVTERLKQRKVSQNRNLQRPEVDQDIQASVPPDLGTTRRMPTVEGHARAAMVHRNESRRLYQVTGYARDEADEMLRPSVYRKDPEKFLAEARFYRKEGDRARNRAMTGFVTARNFQTDTSRAARRNRTVVVQRNPQKVTEIVHDN